MSTIGEALVESLYADARRLIPGLMLHNRAVTTSSIYCKTPDGYSLRIGDHKGREKYSYKWNLWPGCKRGWRRENGRWRYYTDDVEDLAEKVKMNMGVGPEYGLESWRR